MGRAKPTQVRWSPKKTGRKLMIEVSSDVKRFELTVRAESIRRAMSIAEDFTPQLLLRVVYPIEPETFFVRDPTAAAGPVSSKCLTPQRVKQEAAEEMRDHERLVAYFDKTFVVMMGDALPPWTRAKWSPSTRSAELWPR